MANKNTKRKSKSFGEAVGFRDKIWNDTTDFFLGLILLALAVCVIIAMVSYLTTGREDQSILENMNQLEWLNNAHDFTNKCGSAGAMLSYFLITLNFGYPSFLIPLFFVLVSLKLMRVCKVALLKWFLSLVVIMLWLSVTFAKFLSPFMGEEVFNPGGKHGLFCVQFLEGLIGSPGLLAILIVIAIAFLTYLSHETIEVVRKALNPVRYVNSKIRFTVTNSSADNNDEMIDSEESGTRNEEKENTQETQEGSNAVAEPVVVSTDPIIDNMPADDNGENNGSDNASGDTLSNSELVVEETKGEDIANASVAASSNNLDTPINPLEPFVNYHYPDFGLLKKYDNKTVIDMDEVKANNNRIVEVLKSFGVGISEIHATVGPSVTLYEITPAEGVRISRIRGLEADIALSLSALGIRIIAPIPGKGTIGIEVPNKNPQIVSMESVLNTKKFQTTKMALPMALGKTITNEVFMVDLAKLPHLLVAGATGMGKSVGLNAIITSLLYKKHPNELKFVLVDPKKVEFSIYNKIAPHFMAALPENEDEPIITDYQKVLRTLNSLCKLMDHRYDLLKLAQVKKIDEYNDKFVHHKLRPTDGHEYMPYIIVIIDEFGDLIMRAGKEVESPIARIAQLARAVGIHMIIATQRPTTKIITGNIKANFPGRMAFRVTSQIDSRTILDRIGADQLAGKGDMLFLSGAEPVRVQCAYIDTPEIEGVNTFIAEQPGPLDALELPEPEESNGGMGGGGSDADVSALDPYFDEAAHAIVVTQQGSTSMIQRRFSIGYNRAGRLMDQLEKAGIVGAPQGAKPREVMLQDENSLNVLLNKIHAGWNKE